MEIITTKNIVFEGANKRMSLLDVYSPKNVGKHPVVIFLHGFKGFKDWGHFPMLLSKIAENGFHVISFNMSHNGGTTENPIDFPDLDAFSNNTHSKEIFDTESILTWLENQTMFQYSSINIIGHSRGGGIAVLVTNRNIQVKKLITWASVDDFKSRLPNQKDLNNWRKEGVYFIKNGRTKQEMPMKYGFVEDLLEQNEKLLISNGAKGVNVPSLIIHGEKDKAVSFENAKNLNTWIKNSELLRIPKTGHTFDGKHPFVGNNLPVASLKLLEETLRFLKL